MHIIRTRQCACTEITFHDWNPMKSHSRESKIVRYLTVQNSLGYNYPSQNKETAYSRFLHSRQVKKNSLRN